MTKVDHYRETLKSLDDWEPFLLQESGLPGPRGNLELAQAVADEGDAERFEHFLSFGPRQAPTGSPYEFLAFCGVVGLGKLVAGGQVRTLSVLRGCASDPRWRIREGVAMALQRLGDVDMNSLLQEMEAWSKGSWLEKRAAAAALAEPRLLRDEKQTLQVLHILDSITASVRDAQERRSDDFKALRKGLGYCWSVAVVALPEEGKRMMEKWLSSDDQDVLWIMKENLKKARLSRLDAAWVAQWKAQVGVKSL